MRNHRKAILIMALFAIGLVAVMTHVNAGSSKRRYAFGPCHCKVFARISLDNGANLTSNGDMNMNVTGNSVPEDPNHWQTLSAQSFTSSGDDPVLGHVEWTLDETRIAQDARISGNVEGQEFPATCDIYFYVIGTASKLPGKTFRSTIPVHMHADALQTFNPHVNEVYNAVEAIPFEDADNPGEIQFTVAALSSTLN